MRDPLDEVESISRDARRNCAEMKIKSRTGVDLFRRLHDVSLARLDVISRVTGADVGSFADIVAKIEKVKDDPRRTDDAFESWKYEERYQEAATSLLKHFRKLLEQQEKNE